MLPKPEKPSKKNPKVESVLPSEKVSKQDQVKTKRLFVIITLVLTVGLSFVFSLYHYFSNSNFTFNPKFPSFSIAIPTTPPTDIDSSVDLVLKNDPSIWSIYVDTGTFNWSKNSDQLFTDANQPALLQQLNQSKVDNTDTALLNLPQGLDLKKDDTSKQGFYRVSYQIIAPSKQINIFIKISGTDIDSSKKLIPQLISTLYWQLI